MLKEKLSKQEIKVLELLAQGLSNAEIGAHLFVTEKTIKHHLTSIYSKRSVTGDRQMLAQLLNDRSSLTMPVGQ